MPFKHPTKMTNDQLVSESRTLYGTYFEVQLLPKSLRTRATVNLQDENDLRDLVYSYVQLLRRRSGDELRVSTSCCGSSASPRVDDCP